MTTYTATFSNGETRERVSNGKVYTHAALMVDSDGVMGVSHFSTSADKALKGVKGKTSHYAKNRVWTFEVVETKAS
jgi:hypothetical protein